MTKTLARQSTMYIPSWTSARSIVATKSLHVSRVRPKTSTGKWSNDILSYPSLLTLCSQEIFKACMETCKEDDDEDVMMGDPELWRRTNVRTQNTSECNLDWPVSREGSVSTVIVKSHPGHWWFARVTAPRLSRSDGLIEKFPCLVRHLHLLPQLTSLTSYIYLANCLSRASHISLAISHVKKT
jgi:hypothetical protein